MQVQTVRFGHVAELGGAHVDDVAYDTTVFRVQTEGLVGEVSVNDYRARSGTTTRAPGTDLAVDIAGVLNVYGGVLVAIMTSTASVQRVAFDDVRPLAFPTLFMNIFIWYPPCVHEQISLRSLCSL